MKGYYFRRRRREAINKWNHENVSAITLSIDLQNSRLKTNPYCFRGAAAKKNIVFKADEAIMHLSFSRLKTDEAIMTRALSR